LIRPVRRPQQPPPDEPVVVEPDPEPEPWILPRVLEPQPVRRFDLFARPRPATQVPHHLGIGVEQHLPLQVLVGQRHQLQPRGPQVRLLHPPILAFTAPNLSRFLAVATTASLPRTC
jgi:hypothetical protein